MLIYLLHPCMAYHPHFPDFPNQLEPANLIWMDQHMFVCNTQQPLHTADDGRPSAVLSYCLCCGAACRGICLCPAGVTATVPVSRGCPVRRVRASLRPWRQPRVAADAAARVVLFRIDRCHQVRHYETGSSGVHAQITRRCKNEYE